MKKIKTGLMFVSLVLLSGFLFAQSVEDGKTMMYYERYKSAKDIFQKILASNPANEEAAYWLGQTYLASDEVTAKDIADAKALYQAKLSANPNSPLLIAGMGRFGQIVARLLTAQHIPFVALEHSPEQVDDMRRFGNRIYYGDPTRPELLRAAGAQHVKAFVIAVDDSETNIKATRLIRRMYPQARIFARARNRQHAWRLMDLGAEAFRETFGSSLEMGEQVLVALGLPADTAADHTRRFRVHDEKLLRAQHLVYDDDAAVIQTARNARTDLEKLFEADITDSDTLGHADPPKGG